MAALGALRRYDGATWTTFGFYLFQVPTFASLTALIDNEIGQTAYVADEEAFYVWDGTWGKVTSDADLGKLFNAQTEPAAWDPALPYTALAVADHGGTFWIAAADTVAGEEPGVAASWEALTLDHLWDMARRVPPLALYTHGADYVEGDIVWDNGGAYRAKQDITAAVTQDPLNHPAIDATNWDPFSRVPRETTDGLVLTSDVSGLPSWKRITAPVAGYVSATAQLPYGITWDEVKQLTGFDQTTAVLGGRYTAAANIRTVGVGEWAYNAGILLVAKTDANGQTSAGVGSLHVGDIIRLQDPNVADSLDDFLVTRAATSLTAHGVDMWAYHVVNSFTGAGGRPAGPVDLYMALNPTQIAPDSMFVIAEDTTVDAAVPGVGGTMVKRGDILQALDTNGDGATDSYQLLTSDHVTAHRLLSTAPLPATAVPGDVYITTDTHEVGTLIDDPNNPGTTIKGPVLGEDLIRQWIAQSSLFQGTVGDTGTAQAGSIGYEQIDPADPANQGAYYVVTEAFTTVANPGPLPVGLTLNVGDWLVSTGDPALGQGGYSHIPGGVVTVAMADARYVQRVADVDLLVPPAPGPGLVLTSTQAGPGARWSASQSTLAGVISGSHTAANEITWGELAQSAVFNPATVFSADAWTVINPAGVHPAADGEIQVVAGSLWITEYTTAGPLGGPQFSNYRSGAIIRIRSTADAQQYTDFLVNGPGSISGGFPGTGNLFQIPVNVLGNGPNGAPATGVAVEVGITMNPQTPTTALVPNTYYFVGIGATPIPNGVPGIAGQAAYIGDLVRCDDSNGDGVVDTFALISGGGGGGGGGGAIDSLLHLHGDPIQEQVLTLDWTTYERYIIDFVFEQRCEIRSSEAILIQGIQSSSDGGASRYQIASQAGVWQQFAPDSITMGRITFASGMNEGRIQFVQDMGNGEYVTVDAIVTGIGAARSFGLRHLPSDPGKGEVTVRAVRV